MISFRKIIFSKTKLDPTIINGGVLNSFDNSAKLGKSDWSVLEADESDGSFIHIPPTYSIITNIDREHMDYYKSIKDFFDLPTDVKAKYELEGFAGQRGYTSFGKEHAKGKKEGDLKEFWHFGQYLNDDEYNKFNYPKNVFVNELPDFNSIGKTVYQSLEKTAIFVLRAISLYLNLEENHFDKFVEKGNSILRPIHYPPIKDKPKGAERAAAHGDINLITLLMGAHGRGLQVLTNDGEWIDAIAEEDEIIVNVGDMLKEASGGYYPSTTHRVVNPSNNVKNDSRYSMPLFLHPRDDVQLSKNYTAGSYLKERLLEIGLKN